MKVFSREKYLRERITRLKIIQQLLLISILKSYLSWAKECDKLSVEEVKKLGYDVDVDEWLEDK